jgi:hypothetical protein
MAGGGAGFLRIVILPMCVPAVLYSALYLKLKAVIITFGFDPDLSYMEPSESRQMQFKY